MKKVILMLLLTVVGTASIAQNSEGKYIEVKGSAIMEVVPDDIRFEITIKEYWEEEFMKWKSDKHYRTVIKLTNIETKLMKELNQIGITKEQIVLKEAGVYWRRTGKEALQSKTIEIVLKDYKKISLIMNTVSKRGIQAMGISEIKHSKITDFRKEVKIQAIKNAKEKAGYLLGAVDEELGSVVSVEEIENAYQPWYNRYNSSSLVANSKFVQKVNDVEGSMKRIVLKYEIKARFSIK